MQSTVDVYKRSKIILYIYLCLANLVLLSFSNVGAATDRCVADGGSRYEAIFCVVKTSRFGKTLPALGDFRRNATEMQYLMLKRPAGSLGLILEAPKQAIAIAKSKIFKNQKHQSLTLPVILNEHKKKGGISHKKRKRKIAACRYQLHTVTCSSYRYVLQLNKNNRQLSPQALAASNVLVFRSRALFVSRQAYLLDCYIRYIEKMLSIGLSGSSYSYSAFAHLYADNADQGVDFQQRFADTFELLKRDKQTLAVSTRRPFIAPLASECEPLNDDLLVCRSQNMNLVYQRQR